jgi:hypothetical protein
VDSIIGTSDAQPDSIPDAAVLSPVLKSSKSLSRRKAVGLPVSRPTPLRRSNLSASRRRFVDHRLIDAPVTRGIEEAATGPCAMTAT